MYFSVQSDTGSSITGYVVPDSFSAIANVRVSEGSRELLVFQPDEIRPDIRVAGIHETGQCGFTIDHKKLPGLENHHFLELHDLESGLAIYRRRPAGSVTQDKIFRLETRLMPLWRLDDLVEPHFQAFYRNIERLGVSSATQLFQLYKISSSYISGRVNIKPFEFYMNDQFKTVALYRRPYTELAERIMILKHLSITGSDVLGARETMLLGPAIDFFRDVDISVSKQLRNAMRNLDMRTAEVLANPYLRSLIAESPDAVAFDTNIAAGLDALASFALVGAEDHTETFFAAFAELTGGEVTDFVLPQPSTRFMELLQEIESISICGLLIDKDIELYDHICAAYAKAASA